MQPKGEAVRGDEDESAIDKKKCSTFFDVYGPQVKFSSLHLYCYGSRMLFLFTF